MDDTVAGIAAPTTQNPCHAASGHALSRKRGAPVRHLASRSRHNGNCKRTSGAFLQADWAYAAVGAATLTNGLAPGAFAGI